MTQSNLPEVVIAAAAGVPVAATLRGAGFVDLASAGREVVLGDAADLLRAARELLAVPRRPAGTIHSEPDRLRESLGRVVAAGAR